MSTSTAELDRLTQRWDCFRTGRNAALAAPHGWLSLTSFHWLPAAPSALPGVPGLWSFDGTTAYLTAAAEDDLSMVSSGQPVLGTVTAELSDEESLMWVASGSMVVELGMRANRYMVRTRDAQSPTLASFSGVPAFDYDPAMVVTGSFTPFDAPRPTPIATASPEVPGVAVLAGEVSFELDGIPYTLAAEEGALGSLVITFHDASNDVSSSHWRMLELTNPRPDGSVAVDFNRAINYPSAFTDFGTCPAPVPGNTLPVAIEAGERDPRK
ncbi:uncharacterized protein (DUF1684 family) [Arthrobacter stackebrandtii]|uniref:Uncharacterized protein (DUF1684 family) n=1 Tax=Arthrobacter stackebrandtii TaxID=272161 RepID=A0ABS4YTS6_9MICC|nr:DUF1684 domain-containing protein [Arthrobacter stackebrandtii]MBP2412186.1 uncharacterized protein (DUF1684 family) [Arthrobacter stackebrandtii]PYH01978.1 DUF1684 domain-containing protein [Arthrobacter stackebrandtii]